jgi:glucan endo-1,3-beta-D-glucosidase
VTGKKNNLANPNAANARIYWQKIACSLIKKKVNLFWYGLQESQWGTASPDFGIYGPGDLGTLQPRYSLACVSQYPVFVLCLENANAVEVNVCIRLYIYRHFGHT